MAVTISPELKQYLDAKEYLSSQNPVKKSGARGPQHREMIAEDALPELIAGRGYPMIKAAELIGHNPEFTNGVSTPYGEQNSRRNHGAARRKPILRS